jgi:hypothetical protein
MKWGVLLGGVKVGSGTVKNEETQEWVIEQDAKLRPLFAADQFTQIEWAVRHALDGNPLAQWLHASTLDPGLSIINQEQVNMGHVRHLKADSNLVLWTCDQLITSTREMRISHVTKNVAVIALGVIILHGAYRWIITPFVLQIEARQQLTFLCQESSACEKIGAMKVFDRTSLAIQRRVVIVLSKNEGAGAHNAFVKAATKMLNEEVDRTPAWKLAAVRGMLPVEVRHE